MIFLMNGHNEAHIEERNRALFRFQQLAERKRIRITFFSGDVHCCGISRFQTRTKDALAPIHDSRLMYQVISSAIVNIPSTSTCSSICSSCENEMASN